MVRPGQPEPRPALGSAGRGCRRAGCGNRQRRRQRATAAVVTGKIVQGERRTTEKVVAHAGKPRGSEDAAAQAQRRRPWRPRSGTRAQALESERERSERARGSSGAGLSLKEGAGTRQGGRGVDARVGNGGGELTHGCHAQATRHPLGRFREHLAGDGVAVVEHVFRTSTGRI